MKKYDAIIIGAGPGGIFSAYELVKLGEAQGKILKIAVFEQGKALEKRHCPIDGEKIKTCIKCPTCSIMSGFGGAGAFSDGKYNITNAFGGTLYEHVGKKKAIELMEYVDEINMTHGGQGTKLYTTANSGIKKECFENDLTLLDASVRHLGTDINYVVLGNIYNELKDKVDFFFETEVTHVRNAADEKQNRIKAGRENHVDLKAGRENHVDLKAGEKDMSAIDSAEESSIAANHEGECKGGYVVTIAGGAEEYEADNVIVSVGRSGSKWMETVCKEMEIPTNSSRVDIGVRVELPYEVFSHLTDELYESKIVYRTKQFDDLVRTFCMNPHGVVVNENTNGIVTVNGHSYEDPALHTENTNFALLVSKHFTAPFKDSNGYGESIAKLSNMLGGGVIVQRFGDLKRGRRTNEKRIQECSTTPTLNATPGDLSLVIPKRILDDIVEMIEALDKIAPGTANQDTLLYGVEVKFYNMEVEIDENLETKHRGLYVIGDGSGVTHSLSHASASGVHVARNIIK